MALKRVKRCTWCGEKLNSKDECTNSECVSHVHNEVTTTLDELKTSDKDTDSK